jgi:hypothetical protein
MSTTSNASTISPTISSSIGGYAPAIKLLFRPGDIIEVRALKPPEVPFVGRYPFGRELVNALTYFDTELDFDLYYCLNPSTLAPVPMQRYMRGTKKEDVKYRRWFLLDGDPIREQKIATDEQWQAACEVMRLAKAWLESREWTGIIIASSGNGCHLLVPCDLPNTPESEHLVKSVQRAVADRFSTREVLIECFPDADRITRAYGSLNRKGKESEELKHRRSGLLV